MGNVTIHGMTNVGFSPGTVVSWRQRPAADGVGVLQIGSGPSGALLQGVTHREALAVQRLRTAHSPEQFLADAVADRVAPQRAQALLETLSRAGLVGPRPVSPVVAVLGLGPLGLGAAAGLLAAGQRRVHLVDDEPVRPGDVTRDTYPAGSVGSPRPTAAAQVLQSRYPSSRITTGHPLPDVALAVITGLAVLASRRAGPFLATDVPHLPLVTAADGICVGPVVRPGWDACVHCMQLHRLDADPRWAERCLAAGRMETASPLTALAVAAAVAQARAHLDGYSGNRSSVRFLGPDGTPELIDWQPHPRCGCRDQPSVRALAEVVT